MNDQALADELNTLLALESRSLLRHLDEARPFLSTDTFKVWADIETAARHSEDHGHRLSDLIATLNLPAKPAGFNPSVAYYHDVSVESVLPILIDEKTRQAAACERALQHLSSHPRLAEALRDLLADTRHLLQMLQAHQKALARPTPSTTLAVSPAVPVVSGV